MPVVPSQTYPSIEDIFTLTRVVLNDTFAGATDTPGEGLIFTDDAPFALPILNDAIATYIRRLRNKGFTTLTKEVFLSLIPPVNGPMGAAVPDPSIQQYMGYLVFNDGATNYPQPVLPADLIEPLRLSQRNSYSNLTFTEVSQAQNGLASCYQDYSLGQWEWRGDAIYWNGALVQKDIRLRYLATVAYYASTTPVANFPFVPVPFRDSVTALSLLCAEKFAASRLPPGATVSLLSKIDQAIQEIVEIFIRTKQAAPCFREGFGDSGDVFGFS